MEETVEVAFGEDQVPLGIVLRSLGGRPFVHSFAAGSPASKHRLLRDAQNAASHAGQCLVLTAVDGQQLYDAGAGLFHAGTKRLHAASNSRKVLAELRSEDCQSQEVGEPTWPPRPGDSSWMLGPIILRFQMIRPTFSHRYVHNLLQVAIASVSDCSGSEDEASCGPASPPASPCTAPETRIEKRPVGLARQRKSGY